MNVNKVLKTGVHQYCYREYKNLTLFPEVFSISSAVAFKTSNFLKKINSTCNISRIHVRSVCEHSIY